MLFSLSILNVTVSNSDSIETILFLEGSVNKREEEWSNYFCGTILAGVLESNADCEDKDFVLRPAIV